MNTLPRFTPQLENIEPNRSCSSLKSPAITPTIKAENIEQPPLDEKMKVFLRVRPLLANENTIDFNIEDETITIRPPEILLIFVLINPFHFEKFLDLGLLKKMFLMELRFP